MTDPRWTRLSEVLTDHSTRLQTGEKVLIEAINVPDEFVAELIRVVDARGALPLVTLKSQVVNRALLLTASEAQMQLCGAYEKFRMEQVDAYIGVRGSANIAELSDVPDGRLKLYQTHWLKPVHFEVRVPRTKWVVLRWPSSSMAQQADMSTAAFQDFYFRVCCLDYGRLARAMEPLRELMEETDEVRITSPGTELSFSIHGIPAIPCAGMYNVPDGEVFTAPVRDSVNGVVQFNTPTIYHGTTFDRIRLTFRDGRITDATAGTNEARLIEILDTDAGARYLGEFSLGLNPHITRPMKDILFDEKIAGSLHLTPGNAYDEADNGNRSEVHWDMVLRQDPDSGGGEIWFDGEPIRRDGRFLPESLQPLNPEFLTAAETAA